MNLQIIFNGIESGLVLSLLALSFSLVYLPTHIFHIALAGIIVLPPYVAMACMRLGLKWWLAVPISLLVSVVVSVLCELLSHRRLEKKRASHGSHLIASLGAYIIVSQIVAMIWGNGVHVLRTGVDHTFNIGAVVVTQAQLVAVGVSFVFLMSAYFWLRFSSFGLRFRALADNAVEFGLHGYNVSRYRLLAFSLSGLMAGVGALLFAYDVGFDPHGGMHMMLLSVVAVIIGGRASFLGPVIGAILLGVIRSQVVWNFSARWQDVLTFFILAVFLYVRPEGICGCATRLEANE